MAKTQDKLINDLINDLKPEEVKKHIDEVMSKYKDIKASDEEIEEIKDIASKTYVKEHKKFINSLIVKNKHKEKNRKNAKKARKMSCRNRRK